MSPLPSRPTLPRERQGLLLIIIFINIPAKDTPLRGGRPNMAGDVQHQLLSESVGYGDDTQSSEDTGNPKSNQTFPMCQ